MPLLSAVLSALESLAPLAYAEPWDNVGLLIGDPSSEISRVLFTIDLTLPVLAEAASLRCDLIVAYHPPIFDAQKTFTAGNLAFEAARRSIAVYSPHTALDAAPGGTNDTLASLLSLTNVKPLRPAPLPPDPKPLHAKLITYVPPSHADSLAAALFQAGAGHIGNYSHCSFRSPGTGTFLPHPGTNPTIGSTGELTHTPETRLETILPTPLIPQVLAALRAHHPYEEPAYDLIPLLPSPPTSPLAPPKAPDVHPGLFPPSSSPPHSEAAGGHPNPLPSPRPSPGIGRLGTLPHPTPLHDLISHLKLTLNLPHLITSGHPNTLISTIALCAGAGRSLLPDVLRARPTPPDLYITGELPHHDALKLAQSNIATILTLHSNSERPALPPLASRLQSLLPQLTTHLSTQDHDPLSIV